MATQIVQKRPYEFSVYPESEAGGFCHRDCTVAFYTRIDALLQPTDVVLNLGAGRGANILADLSAYRRKVQTFKGRAARVIGLDVDPVVLENPDLDEAHVIGLDTPWPVADASIDMLVSDHVFEHVVNPEFLASEIARVLKPGGWLCARTPTKWGYIGLATRAIPNSLHVALLKYLQPHRKAEDVFPTVYKMNTARSLKRYFDPARWAHHSYGYNGVPGYHGQRLALFRLVEAWCWLMPRPLSAKWHIFLRKK
ncbi:MAG: methyltransferase domain-containing protein [Roseicyclus sp.]|jgi:SAM-dependent methyltransferase|nr:methyltransferase domain-containing protein [Roseicyclus sp.]